MRDGGGWLRVTRVGGFLLANVVALACFLVVFAVFGSRGSTIEELEPWLAVVAILPAMMIATATVAIKAQFVGPLGAFLWSGLVARPAPFRYLDTLQRVTGPVEQDRPFHIGGQRSPYGMAFRTLCRRARSSRPSCSPGRSWWRTRSASDSGFALFVIGA